jgi:large subunit ribosomal protein L17
MRHKKNFNHLGRKTAHRKAMLANMASSLIMHKRIETTTAKAKALKRYIEPLITRSKDDSTHSRRVVFSYLQDKHAVTELFREIGAKVGERPGGYTRIIKLGNRLGDNADMCIIEMVDYNEVMLSEKASAKKSGSRRRRGGKAKPAAEAAGTEAAKTEAVTAEEVVEEVKDVAPAEEVAEEAVEAPAEVVAEAAAEEAEEPKTEEAGEESKDDTEEEKKD